MILAWTMNKLISFHLRVLLGCPRNIYTKDVGYIFASKINDLHGRSHVCSLFTNEEQKKKKKLAHDQHISYLSHAGRSCL